MSSSQFPPIVGLAPTAEAVMQNSGAQSQPGTLSQSNIFSSASIFSPSSSESFSQEVTHSDDRNENEDDLEISQRICQESIQDVVEEYSTQDFSQLLSLEPPPAKRTENWINDALDQAGHKVEIYFFQAIIAALIGLAEIPTSKEGAKQRLADILIMITKALQEARTVRIQGGPSSQGNRAKEANRREDRFVPLSMEENRRREIDMQKSAGHMEEQASQKSSQQSSVQRLSVASHSTKYTGIQDDIRRTNTNRSRYPDGAE
ncbi:uncharacterized protein MONOS_13429c1 [Monocercomonoides exilis]|uniref:uncharacterized protein n=1 Tax=Monocercomonoides exilis TaxID=2049356 RepID=UPI00355A7513|nr:hypothetical protein MONOS_13429c2 [Monocercomonoides exilis]KAH7818776.1 hypothetical protein MONOS_13429c1 [Monocercomonoides exilis]|eukprot:MONOS_13429.1-p1 / transcript=MONOS_13429.1 / gene=MONOS_13429 / organism=Monocercomonoides_exilis_PA203 / gene_product=unspecified product / transcript_product=unspecified product / location=Mono_scaffold00827:23123-24363(+) / protein_length=261 / sequence_SO=supercontig / SO=protein_coding / is_pseudo=false